MSRRDYVEPTEGAWALISSPYGDFVACPRVDRVTDDHWARVAHLSDGSMWAVETGAPLHRRWAGHKMWTADLATVIDACYRRFDEQPDLDTWAKVLAVLLDAERAKRGKQQ